MFDSPLGDWVPGRPKLFGWPWHGRLEAVNGGTVRLQLPNGSGINIEAQLDDSESANAGTLQLFQDPRATATERTAAELAADVAAGREWRPQVLFSPPACIIYGNNRYRNRTRGDCRWLYHDGDRNWIASLSSIRSTLYLIPLLPISRKASDDITQVDAQVIEVAVSRDFTPSGAGNRAVYIDAVQDGHRAIVGAYQTLPLGDVASNASALSYCRPVEYYEITLSKNADGDFSASLSLLRSEAEVAGVWAPPAESGSYGSAYASVEMNWARGAVVVPDPVNPVYSWTTAIALKVSSEKPVLSPGKRFGWQFQGSSPSSAGALRDRIVGLWYSGDSVQVATMNIDYSSAATSGDASGALSVGAQIMVNGTDAGGVPAGYSGWGGHNEVLQPGAVSGMISQAVTAELSVVVTLAVDGEAFSTTEYHETRAGTAQTSISAGLTIDAGSTLLYESSTAETTVSVPLSRALTVDSEQVYAVSSTSGQTFADLFSYQFLGGPAAFVPVPANVLSYSSGIAQVLPGAGVSSFVLFPVRYCPKVVGLATVQRSSSGVAQKHWVGKAAHPGGVLSQKRAGTGMLPLSLYGCFNPLTQQASRDLVKPESFI